MDKERAGIMSERKHHLLRCTSPRKSLRPEIAATRNKSKRSQEVARKWQNVKVTSREKDR